MIDDSGIVVGTVARGEVIAPTARFHPLEIAAAADFVTAKVSAQAAPESPISAAPARSGPLKRM